MPGESISVLRKNLRGVYWWLNTHDKEWLMANRPPSRQRQTPKNQIPLSLRSTQKKTLDEDPVARDMRIADIVKACAQTLIDEPGYPKRVTKRKILLAVPESEMRWFEQHEDPLTASAFQEVLETPEAFALRRMRWFVQKCQQEQRHPTRREFIQSIHIYPHLHIPEVLNALNGAMDTLS